MSASPLEFIPEAPNDHRFLGTTTGHHAVYTDNFAWDYAVFDLVGRFWLANDDPDFPRFKLEKDAEGTWLHDLDTTDRWLLVA